MQNPLSIRPTEEMEKKLEKLIEIEKIEKSTLIRKILTNGIDEELKKCVLQLFKDKKVSLAKAAEIAGISIREMIDLIKEQGESLHITVEDIQEDFEAAMK
jgi:predicted HTH domain antitoxin